MPQNSHFLSKSNAVPQNGEKKEGNRKELEFISLNNRNSELARREKPFIRVICKEFITLPQVFFLESILSNLEDFFFFPI